MEMSVLNKMLNNLSWDKPKIVQENAIKSLERIDDEYTPLLIMEHRKDCWENAVKVLDNIGYPRNRYAIPKLVWLLQDINWPGVPHAIEIMEKIEKDELIKQLSLAIIQAGKINDTMWIAGIKSVIELLEIQNDFSEDIFHYLKLADW